LPPTSKEKAMKSLYEEWTMPFTMRKITGETASINLNSQRPYTREKKSNLPA